MTNFPEQIASKIFFLRGQKVMFDFDLAFEQGINELQVLRSQFVTSKPLELRMLIF